MISFTAKLEEDTDNLNEGQAIAVDKMVEFLKSDLNFFLLTGFAGTGKTYCIRNLINKTTGKIVFTAPTNKATKVLRDTLTTSEYKPECRTIYSLLGLKLEANGAVKEISSPEDIVDLGQYKVVVIDEGSMANKHLTAYIDQVAEEQNVKFIIMGDEAQIPPVGEIRSLLWDMAEVRADLTEMMRYDSELLDLATMVRKCVYSPAPRFKPVTANTNGEGVWVVGAGNFQRQIQLAAEAGRFSNINDTKAVAWRNKTVDSLNSLIRSCIFDDPSSPWLPDDRVMLMEPAKNLDGDIIGTTDDEGTITRAEEGWHPVWPEYKVWNIKVTGDDNTTKSLIALHEDSFRQHQAKVADLAGIAQGYPRGWKDYWEFREAFHKVRHSYAITAHRSQGSTYDTVFVDWRDILVNRNMSEAYRCMYVACTRASKRVILN
jgi:exodeoxyribonuclease-5